jgi:hypothetical protein
MTATLTLDLFRPAILDPVEDEGRSSEDAPRLFRDLEPGEAEAAQQRLRPPWAREAAPARQDAPSPSLFRAPAPREVAPAGDDTAPSDAGAKLHRASEQGGGLTLDDLVVGVWEGLSAHRAVACPACGGEMTPRYGAGPAPVGGRCRSCGTTLA